MATGKRYYWIKLKESFMTSDTVDYMMSLPNGANYVVLYQILCLKTINTNGRLSRQIGEILIPYDVDKIQRDCKWFSADTIRVALTLFRSFGLIYEDQKGVLVLSDHGNLIGSETDFALQKQMQRQRRQQDLLNSGKGVDISVDNVHANVHTDIDKEIDIYNNTHTAGAPAREGEEAGGVKTALSLPDEAEIAAEFRKLKLKEPETEAKAFAEYNNLRGWADNWRLKAALWAKRATKQINSVARVKEGDRASSFDADEFFKAALERTYGKKEDT